MKTYEYEGLDRAGRKSKGLIEAASVKDARDRLVRDGVFAEKVSPAGGKIRFGPDRRATVYREFGALLGAGLPVVRAFDLLIQSPELGEARVLLAGVRDQVRDGVSLASAFASASEAVTPFELAIIEAAERSATIDVMLERLADFIEEQEKLRAKVQGALVYPMIILTVGLCVAVLMLGLLVPRARDILAGSGIPLPFLTRFMIGLGRALLFAGVPLAAAAAAGVVQMRRRLRQSGEFRERWDRLLFRLPMIGGGYAILANLRFARTLSILIRGGVPLIEGVTLAGRATGSAWVARLAEDEASAVRHGSSLSDALRRIPPLAPTLPGWVQIGEAGGGLEKLMEKAGLKYQDRWERYVNRSLALLEPMLILLIGGFVLLITLSVLMPILSMTHAIGK